MAKFNYRRHVCVLIVLVLIVLLAFIIMGSAKNYNDTIHSGYKKVITHQTSLEEEQKYICLESTSYAYAQLPDRQITTGQEYYISFLTNTNKKIIDYKYSAEGFTIISSRIEKNTVVFLLKNIALTDKAKLHIEIYLEDQLCLPTNVHAIINDEGVYLSSYSQDDAFECYLNSLYANGKITENQLHEQKQDYYSKGVMEESHTTFETKVVEIGRENSASHPIKANADVNTYVEGVLQWKDNDGNLHPVNNVRVDLYDHDGIYSEDDYLSTAYTDQSGRYRLLFKNQDSALDFDNGGCDLYIQVYAGDENAYVVKSDTTTRYSYFTSPENNMDVKTGSTTTINLIIDMSTDFGKALQISQAVICARDFAEKMMGKSSEEVRVVYPYDGNSCCGEGIIWISNNEGNGLPEYASWDVIMHEYGHHVQNQLGFAKSTGDRHSFYEDLAEKYGKDIGIRLAFAESWATIFGAVAQDYYSNVIVDEIKYNYDEKYNAANGAYVDYENPELGYGGEACEAYICAVLWDIFDGEDEPYDSISLSYQEWWDVTTKSGNNTLSNFMQSFYSDYPLLMPEVGEILTYLKIAPSMINRSINMLKQMPIIFYWYNNGGSKNYYNDELVLRVYDATHTNYFDVKGNIVRWDYDKSPVSALPTLEQWNQMLSWPGYTVDITMIAYQNSDPATGGYFSEFVTIEKSVFKTENVNGKLAITGTYCPLSADLEIPSSINGISVEEISDYAFKNQNTIESVKLPTRIKRIGKGAFEGCEKLCIVDISQTSITEIEEHTFDSTNIIDIKFPGELETIGEYAFANTNSIFILPKSLKHIGNNAFENTLTSFMILPNSIVDMGQNVFKGCENLTIYTQHTSAPQSWDSNWNPSQRPVVWGCNLSDDGTYIISIEKKHGSMDNLTNGYTNPLRAGYIFAGWYLNSSFTGTSYDLASAPNGMLYAKWDKACVADGSMITLADGTRKAVEDLTGEEQLLVWNMFTGKFDSAPILFIDRESENFYEVINLHFSDGTVIKVISEHAFWDINLNQYVFLRKDAAQYIGHWFNKQSYDSNGNMIYTEVQLTNVVVDKEYTSAWSPVTYGHLCYYVNDVLSMPGETSGLINIFEVNPQTMKIDGEAYLSDIERYGLFTYEEFNAKCPIPEEVFYAFRGQYLKVALGKGLITWGRIEQLIAKYSKFWDLLS